MEIHKEAIACFVITRSKRSVICATPLVVDADGFNGPTSMEVFANDDYHIVPAPPNSYVVYGSDNDHPKWILLGYEYHGASHNVWEQVFDDRKAEMVNYTSEIDRLQSEIDIMQLDGPC